MLPASGRAVPIEVVLLGMATVRVMVHAAKRPLVPFPFGTRVCNEPAVFVELLFCREKSAVTKLASRVFNEFFLSVTGFTVKLPRKNLRFRAYLMDRSQVPCLLSVGWSRTRRHVLLKNR
ncbi:MAG: hypothetical protein DMG78_32295 [Acidobacteria bacterium]|nr:MAG: hypothetical protein DMG78_32295 [Acidobacteriota bacterium]